MPIFPGAVWRGNCANTDGPRNSNTRGAVLHVNDGPNVSLWDWVNKAASSMSCHFQILQNGLIEQYLDTELISWCQMDGNRAWISIEMPTTPDVGMTAAQIAAGGRVLAWLASLYKFPLALTDDPINGYGLGWHGMGGADWGGHFGCPGDIRKAQRQALLTAAGSGTSTPGDDSMSAADVADLKSYIDQKIGTMPYEIHTQIAPAVGAVRGLVQALNATINDPASGTHVRVSQLQAAVAALPAAIAAAIAALPSGTVTVDVNAIADAVVAKLAAKLGAAA